MRLHRLEITAFGPFADTVTVDFDDLSSAGLFLLCGPTGAGKTSVLDAVCFGLYGDVPGDRSSARRLRCDQSRPGVAPRVVLETDLSGRRFRLTRSPQWQRPKKRGTGQTSQQPSVLVEERDGDGWRHLSSRLDESGQLVGELVGMTMTQFCQVAMLPQGRFHAFLRARSEERHKVLQQLFNTSRFDDIEKWLNCRRLELRAENARHHDVTASIVSRLSETAESPVPETWDAHDLTLAAESGQVDRWANGLVASAHRTWVEGAASQTTAAAEGADARSALEAARCLSELRERHRRARAEADELARSARTVAHDQARLDDGRRATRVQPLVEVSQHARSRMIRTARIAQTRLAEARHRLPAEDLTAVVLDRAAAASHDAAGRARALQPRERHLRAATRLVAETETSLLSQRLRVEVLEHELGDEPLRLAGLRDRLDAAATTAGRLQPVTDRVELLTARRESARTLIELRGRLVAAEQELTVATDRALSLKERWLHVREARLDGMAAELALDLAVGGCCPVCGSAEHPSLAEPELGSFAAADESLARKSYEDADFDRQTRADLIRDLETRCAVADQAASMQSVTTLDAALATAGRELTDCTLAAAEQRRLLREIAEVEIALTSRREELSGLRADLARLETTLTLARDTVTTIGAELAALFADSPLTDVARLVEAHTTGAAVFSAARDALVEHERATAEATEAERRAAAATAAEGFDSESAAAAALVSAPLEESLTAGVHEHRGRVAAVQAVLTDPVVDAAAEATEPDVDGLTERVRLCDDATSTAQARAGAARARLDRLVGRTQDLDVALAAWAPSRSAYAVAHRMSTLADGRSADNRWQMRLSAYVLSARLSQVVAAANQRLARMSDQRYALEHTPARGVGETRGGLSLLIRDEWSGESRDPVTLSGGETFVVSLALALGLADVVTQEAGGADMDTLFVDEGFGSLDADTLDDVMDTLDSLRDGGRVVGVVSHVPELRTRIPTQLHVDKGRSGSAVRQVRALA